MQLYETVAYNLSRHLTKQYSTSFNLASRLFDRSIRHHIYAIYGVVRLADEIVDTYQGDDRTIMLDEFTADTLRAVATGYSANPLVHSFATTAQKYGITAEIIQPFFDSMRMDLTKKTFTKRQYDAYIYGSAEVIGLMCLKVFCDGDQTMYRSLESGARTLGSAYQKVNFLRDFGEDYSERQRIYFPGVTFDAFDETVKDRLIREITGEFVTAKKSIEQLPRSARRAVRVSYKYYAALLNRLSAMTAQQIKQERAHVPNTYKFWVLARTLADRP